MARRVLSVLAALAFLLTGCAGTGPAPGAVPQEDAAEDVRDDLHLSVVRTDVGCDAAFCVDALAENEGTRTFHVSSICVPPFSDAMHRDGERVQHREPVATCLAFGTAPFAPGDSREARFSWDGRLWDDAAGRHKPAPEGAYDWTVHFEAYQSADGGGRVVLEAAVPVVVGGA